MEENTDNEYKPIEIGTLKKYLKLENVLRIGTVLLAVNYLMGYLVVTIYLSRFGVSTFEVLKLQYLTAGFWLLLPYLVGMYMLAQYTVYRLKYRSKETRANFRSHLIMTSTLFLLAVVPFVNAILGRLNFPALLMYLLAPIGIILIFGLTIDIVITRDTYMRPLLVKVPELKSHFSFFNFAIYSICISGLILFLSGSLWLFAYTTYPLIPRSLGGGMPVRAKVITKGPNPLASSHPLDIVDSSNAIYGGLLLETSDEVVLVPYDTTKLDFWDFITCVTSSVT